MAIDIHITNALLELYIQGSLVGISHDTLELYLTDDLRTQISQDHIEIYQSDYHLQDFHSQIELSSYLESDTGPDPRLKWIVDDNSKKIYLVRLQVRRIVGLNLERKFIYLSNFAFNTHPDESPPNTEFRTLLVESNIPPLVQKLSEVFYGISTPSYGQLSIFDVKRELNQYLPPSYTWDAGEITIRLTGDRQELPLIFALDILVGEMGTLKFDETKITVDIFSKHRQLEKRKLAEETFKGLDGQDVIGQIPYGYCRNVTPVLIDDVDLIYKYSIVPCVGVYAVYDDGVSIPAFEHWVDDPNNGTLTLLVNPAGTITIDIAGKRIGADLPNSVPGVFSAKRGDFILDALTTYGKLTSANIKENSFEIFNDIAGGDSGIYINQTIDVLQFITNLLLPVLGFLVLDRFGNVSLGNMSIPAEDGKFDLDLSETNMLPISGGGGSRGGESGDKSLETSFYEVKTLSSIINKGILLYDQNNTVQQESSLGDDTPVESETPEGRNRRAWLTEEWRKATYDLWPPLTTLYDGASEPQEPIASYFLYQGDAILWAARWVEMFGYDRRIVQIKTKIEPLQFTINATARLTLGGNVIGYGRVIGYKEDYGDSSVITDFLV